jgi:hypothetical protein
MNDGSAVALIPRPTVPGDEMDALRRFHRDGTWSGTIHADGMGPGTPTQIAVGEARHHWIQEGRWVVGEYEQDQLTEDGVFILKWELHWVCGWDPMAGEYKATIADNYGRVAVLRGRIDNDLMLFESTTDQPPFLRLTWEATPHDTIIWRNEMSLDGSSWFLIEDYEITPTV